jgi:hypothetical protein
MKRIPIVGGSSAGRSGTIALPRIGPVPPGCTQAASMPASMMPGYPGYGPM